MEELQAMANIYLREDFRMEKGEERELCLDASAGLLLQALRFVFEKQARGGLWPMAADPFSID